MGLIFFTEILVCLTLLVLYFMEILFIAFMMDEKSYHIVFILQDKKENRGKK